MGCSSRAHASWTCFLILLALVLGTRGAQAQSCSGRVAGEVCRPAAGACDVAETCQVTGGGGVGGPLYQPTDGTLFTDVAGDYAAGYAFTPNKTLTVTSLGGFFNGTRTVSLYNRATGAVLASASVTSSNGWAYISITPVTLAAGTAYSVAVSTVASYSPGGGPSRSGLSSMPSALADASVDGTCYRPANTGEPCAYSGLIAGVDYGMADLQYTRGGNGLTCPADTLVAAGMVCRAATGSLDIAETFTGSSAACPAEAFLAPGVR